MAGEAIDRLCDARAMDAATATALVAESAKRSGLLWVRRAGLAAGEPPSQETQSQPVWHLWHEGSAYLLTGGIEQPAPAGLVEPGARAEVTARSKDTGARLVVWPARVQVVEPATPEWDVVAALLQSRRLNSPDGERAPQRWAAECRLLRLTPDGEAAAPG
jgi:hypothetical protein